MYVFMERPVQKNKIEILDELKRYAGVYYVRMYIHMYIFHVITLVTVYPYF